MSVLTKPEEFQAMRRAGRLVAEAHAAVREAMKPGITPRELDAIAERVIVAGGGKPAFKGLYGFPSTICASVNEEVVHGIPNRRKLEEGDIISVDIGSLVEGFYGDSAWTYPVGKVGETAARLLEVTERSLYRAIETARAGVNLEEVGGAIQDLVEAAGFSVVRDYVGHGVGRKLHEPPQIPHYRTGTPGAVLQSGEAIAIEPMVNVGGFEVRTKKNGWTVVTVDGALSAHFEHTIIVGEHDAEIMTKL